MNFINCITFKRRYAPVCWPNDILNYFIRNRINPRRSTNAPVLFKNIKPRAKLTHAFKRANTFPSSICTGKRQGGRACVCVGQSRF